MEKENAIGGGKGLLVIPQQKASLKGGGDL
jgi:hypothetical protein